jgi:hypothetical protein
MWTLGMEWPKRRLWESGKWEIVDVETMQDPATGIDMCRDCWDGNHSREGCLIDACKCGCYHGSNRGLGKPRPPKKSCKEQQSLPDVGQISI